jgi:hypothetical protein
MMYELQECLFWERDFFVLVQRACSRSISDFARKLSFLRGPVS